MAKGMWNVYEQPQRATKEKTTSYGGAGVEGIQSRGGRKRERGIGWERGREKERDNTRNTLVLSVLEPVGRLGSFGVTDHVNPIGFSVSHHV